jgi:hypothetical protein
MIVIVIYISESLLIIICSTAVQSLIESLLEFISKSFSLSRIVM